ncbi:MAG: hypothetical protein AABW92_05615 [Nanoarchaeota archaeon]
MNYKEKKVILILVLAAAILLNVFHYFRLFTTPVMPFYEQYGHLSTIKSGEILQESPYLLDAILSYSNNYVFFMQILPYITGLVNIFLLYLISKRIMQKPTQRIFTLAILIASPVFLYLYGSYNSVFLPLFFILLSILVILRGNYLLALFGLIFTFILNQKLFFAIAILLIVIFEKTKSKKAIYSFFSILTVTGFFILTNNLVYNINFYYFLTNYLSDLGAIVGIGLFGFVLSLVGIIISWKEKSENSIIYIALIAFIIFSIYDPSYIIFVDIIVSYYAGIALYNIINRKWSTKTLGNYIILLILCGLIFSSGAYIKKVSEIGPSEGEVRSLEWLIQYNKSFKVLSHYKYGSLIKGVSGFEPYVDESYFLYSKDKVRITSVDNIFQSRDSVLIRSFLAKNYIRYIWINQPMTNGEVWTKDDEGMLLVLNTEKAFRRIYDFNRVQIWEYLG